MTTWSKNDELFKKELKEGYAWQELPALFFKLNGFIVDMPELTIREGSIKNAAPFFNTLDLKVNNKRIEVKSRKETFTSPESFPYDTTIVDTVKKFNKREEKPFAYIMISRFTGCMLWVDCATKDEWQIVEKFDKTRHFPEKFFVIEKSKLKSLDSLLKVL